jgi:hypothetical protein
MSAFHPLLTLGRSQTLGMRTSTVEDWMKELALAARFGLELCLLTACAFWAAHLDTSLWGKIAAAAVLCLTTAILWGLFLSPKRRFELGGVGRALLEALYFAAAAAILVALGHSILAALLLAAEAGDQVALKVLR